MEIRKITFKEKDDVQKQWLPLSDEHWEACNLDCTEWFLKDLGDKYLNGDFSHCHTQPTAKGTIWW